MTLQTMLQKVKDERVMEVSNLATAHRLREHAMRKNTFLRIKVSNQSLDPRVIVLVEPDVCGLCGENNADVSFRLSDVEDFLGIPDRDRDPNYADCPVPVCIPCQHDVERWKNRESFLRTGLAD